MRKLNQFDPQVGNILDVVILRAASASKQCYLAFPMGEVNRDLSMFLLFNLRDNVIKDIRSVPLFSLRCWNGV